MIGKEKGKTGKHCEEKGVGVAAVSFDGAEAWEDDRSRYKERLRVCTCASARAWTSHSRGGTFEISIWNSRGYRYASCFPPAITAGFPFLFVFTGPFLPRSPPSAVGLRIPMSPGHPGRRGASRRRCWCFFDILRHFVSNPRGKGALGHLGPYSTFMALSRDEVSREWTNAHLCLFLSSLALSLSMRIFLFFFIPSDRILQFWLAKCRRIRKSTVESENLIVSDDWHLISFSLWKSKNSIKINMSRYLHLCNFCVINFLSYYFSNI